MIKNEYQKNDQAAERFFSDVARAFEVRDWELLDYLNDPPHEIYWMALPEFILEKFEDLYWSIGEAYNSEVKGED